MKNKAKILIGLVVLIMLPLLVTGFKDEKTSGNAKNTKFKDNVVFYVQHQDDETLWASPAIINAIHQVGADHVYIVQVSYGTGIKIFKNEKMFKNMSDKEKYEYREREFLAAVKDLGIKRKNVIILPRINKSNSTDFQLEENQALKFEKELKSVTHVAHTYKLDWHLEHLKNGSVIQSLYNAGMIKDVKYFVKPQYEKDIPEKERIYYKVLDEKDKEKVRKACGEYKLIDKSKKRDGIGYKSDHKSFDRLMRIYYSILHTPNV